MRWCRQVEVGACSGEIDLSVGSLSCCLDPIHSLHLHADAARIAGYYVHVWLRRHAWLVGCQRSTVFLWRFHLTVSRLLSIYQTTGRTARVFANI